MAVWGAAALNQAGVGANAGIGEVLPFYRQFYDDNFGGIEQGLGSQLSDRDGFLDALAGRIRGSADRAAQTGQGVTRRNLSRYGIALDPRLQDFVQQEQGLGAALGSIGAVNTAIPQATQNFTDAQQAFGGLGANMADMVIGNDVNLQGYDIARRSAQVRADQNFEIQDYINRTAVEQARRDARLAIDAARDQRNGTLAGQIAASR